MARIISIANQKGGVGKTTTVLNMGSALHKEGKRVLLVDLDPQAALSTSLAIPISQLSLTAYQVLLSQTPIQSATRHSPAGLDLIPANIDLAAAELELAAEMGRERILAEALQPVEKHYDFILIDCPPSLGLLTVNALAAADAVLVPVQCEYYALEGLSQLLNTVTLVKRRLNPLLKIEGFLLTMFDVRNRICSQVADEVRRHFQERVFQTLIARNVRLSEAPSHGQPALLYDPASRGAQAYLEAARELLGRRAAQQAP
jgi:chromosome partitioning protein